MKRTFYSVLAAAILAVMVAACGGNGGSIGSLSNAKWEYMVFSHEIGTNRAYSYETEKSYNEVLNQKLNELGAQGWELVSTGTGRIGNGYHDDNVLYLKRKL